MAAETVTIGEIFTRLGELLRQKAGPAAACVAGLIVVNLLLDLLPVESSFAATTVPAGFASLAAQYYLTATCLESLNLREPGGRNRFGAFWGLNLLSGLGILLGYILLIVPGIYLSARWSVASVALLAEDDGVNDALGESWAMTRRSLWAIAGTLLVIFVPALVVGAGLDFLFTNLLPPAAADTILELFVSSAFVLSWLASVAIYSLLRPGKDHLAEVFA